jgi:hypothetical protein
VPRALIRWAAARADGLITVSAALKQPLVDLGTAPERVVVLRNASTSRASGHPPTARGCAPRSGSCAPPCSRSAT